MITYDYYYEYHKMFYLISIIYGESTNNIHNIGVLQIMHS